MTPALAACLTAPLDVPEQATVAAWWTRWRHGASHAATPVARAIGGGFDADRVGWAFASGYQAALQHLCPELPTDAVAAFCVTEEGGNRPRDITTRFTAQPDGAWRIDGAKRWTTLGPDSGWLLVVGAMPAEAAADRPALRVARVATGADGVTLAPMPTPRFVPEVPHARLALQGVRVAADALLPGDGYARYVKPFRTIEDGFVTLAVLAYLLREARTRGWPAGFGERLCAAIEALAATAQAPADAAPTHVLLAGALQWAHGLYAEAGALWAGTPQDAAAQRWQRDTALFTVASAARTQRAERAWQRLGDRGTA